MKSVRAAVIEIGVGSWFFTCTAYFDSEKLTALGG
jgi:hypothetical protein